MAREPRSRDQLRAAIVLLLIHWSDDVPGGATPTDEDYTEGGEIPSRRHILNGAAIRNIEHIERRRSYTLLDAALRELEEQHPAMFRVIHRVFLDEHASWGSEMKRLKERAAGSFQASRDLVRYNGGIEFLVSYLAPYDAHEELWAPMGPDVEAAEKKRTRMPHEAYAYYRKKFKEHRKNRLAVRQAAAAFGYSERQLYRIIEAEEEYAEA